MLFHGPPGTGKTSLIRILSKYFDRHIQYVKLSKIESFNELIELFFGSEIKQKDCFGSLKKMMIIPPKEKIFIIEDVDRECKEVLLKKEVIEKDKKLYIPPMFNVSDLLQAFDGVFQDEGRILIITTNNIDSIDPVLLRPGRITIKLLLKELTLENAYEMINYYFKNETIDYSRVKLKDFEITPAKLENMCQRAESLEKLYSMIEDEK